MLQYRVLTLRSEVEGSASARADLKKQASQLLLTHASGTINAAAMMHAMAIFRIVYPTFPAMGWGVVALALIWICVVMSDVPRFAWEDVRQAWRRWRSPVHRAARRRIDRRLPTWPSQPQPRRAGH
ncbi:MAG: hypothetical protein QM770_17445 [Tepidisphaeraceae bacterium]